LVGSWSDNRRTQRLVRGLRGDLFAAAPEAPPRFGRGRAALIGIGLLVLAVALQLLRVGPSSAFDSLWAEDGQIYLQGAIGGGFVHELGANYAGYLVVVPRLIGAIGAAVPLRDAPAAIAISSAVVVALSGLAVWVSSANLIRNPYLRGVLVTATVLAPTASLESVASGAYVVWFMLVGAFWLLFWRPRSDGGAVLGALFLLATGLSTPGVWFFAPVALLRLLALRDRRDAAILGGFFLGAAIQVPVLAANTEQHVQPLWSSGVWTSYLQRVLDAGFFGDRAGGVAWEWFGWPFLILLLALAGAGLYAGLRRSTDGGRWFALAAVLSSVLSFVVSVYQRAVGSALTWPAGARFSYGGRYTIVPALLLVSAAFVLIDRSLRSRQGGGSRRLSPPVLIASAVTGLAVATCFYVGSSAARGEPSWSAQLSAGGKLCAAQGLEATTLATSPPGFGISIPCDQLPQPSGGAP
jgi:hypothetical protein